MDNLNSNTTIKNYTHLSLAERFYIETRIKEKDTVSAIAKALGRSRTTIYSEIKRGTVSQIKQNKHVKIYYADAGQAIYEKARLNCGRESKFKHCQKFLSFCENKILKDKWSPDVCCGYAKANNMFDVLLCEKSLYNYIDSGLLKVKNIDLKTKVVRKKRHPKAVIPNKKNHGTSISERPEICYERTEFGHWEFDCVIGKKTKEDSVIVSMTELKTRAHLIFKIKNKDNESIEQHIQVLKSEYGDKFNQVFKSITVDNGSEFSTLEEVLNGEVPVYYCHPFSSWERATNERHNGIVRNYVPKGTPINRFSEDDILEISDRLNSVPKKILGYKSPLSLFDCELDEIYAS